MSEPSPIQQVAASSELACAHIGSMVQQLKGDENEPMRRYLLNVIGGLRIVADQVAAGELEVQAAPGPVDLPAGVRNLRALGDDTRGRLSNGGAWRVQ